MEQGAQDHLETGGVLTQCAPQEWHWEPPEPQGDLGSIRAIRVVQHPNLQFHLTGHRHGRFPGARGAASLLTPLDTVRLICGCFICHSSWPWKKPAAGEGQIKLQGS